MLSQAKCVLGRLLPSNHCSHNFTYSILGQAKPDMPRNNILSVPHSYILAFGVIIMMGRMMINTVSAVREAKRQQQRAYFADERARKALGVLKNIQPKLHRALEKIEAVERELERLRDKGARNGAVDR